ncbi:protein NO VEIN domain-containing protein [Flavobacterium inviolabile]|uniref:protein NO VEIN domain-containing protein n=1 Tax=Flavobacterium inviolabile TaxID=2748320 RepID=UPI0015B0ED96|nr:DUF3883 domain-containing protein [Flavobacterium inviolabile]
MIQTVVEILIDNSGSMGYMKGAGLEHKNRYLIDGVTRMSLVKKILLEQIIPTLKYADQIIIRTFRHETRKINNQVVTEATTPLIYNDIFDEQRITKKVSSLVDPPSGGTPITAAIEIAIKDLKKYSVNDRKIILLTDGEENGDGNYIEAAKKAKLINGVECKIFIIGLAHNESSKIKAKEIATGGYFNIASKNFSSDEVLKILEPLKVAVLENTIQNFKITQNESNIERAKELLSSGIDSTTLTIDEDYSEAIRLKSETYLYSKLCEIYEKENVNWLNQNGESNQSYDFEVLNPNGTVQLYIECKGTAYNKSTFYLTAKEWHFFLSQKENYQVYRILNIENEPSIYLIENLFESIFNGKVVPYLLAPEILKEERVFLTLK